MVFRLREHKRVEGKEPRYDDDTIAIMEEMETAELIQALLNYGYKLEKMIVKLRDQINKLTPKGQRVPFPELHENIYERFYDYLAYQEFKQYLNED